MDRKINRYPEYQRLRICIDCDKEEYVRKDNMAPRCLSCSARKRGRLGNETQRKNRLVVQCENCKKDFFTTKSAMKRAKTHYCSRECRLEHKRVSRVCQWCGDEFFVSKSKLSHKSHSSAHYCSRSCYEKVLIKPDRITGRGSQWKKIREQALSQAPFCALCGTVSRLQVHHIVPFRITQDNAQNNLIPLCVRCHKIVEIATQNVEQKNLPPATLKIFFYSLLKEKQLATRSYLRALQKEA